MRPLAFAAFLLVLSLVPAQAAPAASPEPHERAQADARRALAVLQDFLAPDRLAPFAMDQEPVLIAFPMSESREVSLGPLGDLDGDGRDEVLLVDTLHGQEESTTRAAALRAPGLVEEAWSEQTQDGGWWAVHDVDGDGVRDVLADAASDGSGTFDFHSVPLVPAYAYTSQYGFAFDMDLRSGRDAGVLAQLSDRFDQDAKAASVSPGFVYGSASAGTGSSSFWWFGAGATIWHQEDQATYATAYGGALVAGEYVQVQDHDGGGSVRALDGTVLAQHTVTGPAVAPLGTVPLLGDAPRLASAWVESPPGAWLPLPVPLEPAILHVGVAQQGGLAWERQWDLAPYLEAELNPLPDLDGDGFGELELMLLRLDLQAPDLVAVTSAILDGATGAQVAGVSGGLEALVYFVPFGDLEGDGQPELLAAAFDPSTWQVAVSLVRADLTPVWSRDPAMVEPVNWLEDYSAPGFADLTGDGVPDLALAQWDGEDDDGLTLVVADGRDGTDLWSRDFGEDDGLQLLGESSGAGALDMAVLTLTGVQEREDGPDDASNATLSLQVIAGEDGRVLRSQVLRSPGTVPAGPSGVDAWATGVGDVDGDGLDEFAVMVADWYPVPEDGEGEGDDWIDASMQGTAYVFSVASEQPLLALAPQPDQTELSLPADLPAPEVFSNSLAEEPAADAPLPAVVALVATLAAVLMMRRRRA